MGSPFNRAKMMMTMMAAAVANIQVGTVQYKVAHEAAVAATGPYVSHGKRKTAYHERGGTAGAKRLARKRRNVRRNRRAHRGRP